MILGFSIGSLHNFIETKNRDDYITHLRQTNLYFNAIELIFGLETFQLTKENIDWINSLDYTSLHVVPFVNHALDFEIDNYIYHSNWITNNLFYKENTLIENPEIKESEYYFDQLTNDFNICCDISHALAFGMDYLKEFVIKYHDKIRQFHLSDFDSKHHVPFHFNTAYYTVDRLFRIKEILDKYDLLKLPFIIECNFENELDLIKEFNYVKRVLWGI